MAAEQCPKCGARVQPTDTQCMDCGTDLLEERRKAEQTLIETARLPAAAAAPPPPAAARGISDGERSEETRMRVFDEHLARQFVGERQAAYGTALIALVLCGVLAMIAARQIHDAGGLAAVRDVTPARLRDLGWGAFADAALTGTWRALAALSGVLCLVGQTWRGVMAGRSIRAVANGQKPVLVGISTATKAGLSLFSIICPPAGVILGLVLKASNDDETKALGGLLIWAGFAALLAVVLNWLWGLAEHIKIKPRPDRTRKAVLLLAPICTTISALWCQHSRRRPRSG